MTSGDWEGVRAVYAAGIATGNATFETAPPDRGTWDHEHLRSCRLVARRDGEVVGWAALSAVSGRCVYGGVAEVGVYVDPAQAGRGIGSALLGRLVEAAEAEGMWTLQAGIFPENAASIALHRRNGFRVVGTRERIGRGDGGWRDVVLMERRSPTVGID